MGPSVTLRLTTHAYMDLCAVVFIHSGWLLFPQAKQKYQFAVNGRLYTIQKVGTKQNFEN